MPNGVYWLYGELTSFLMPPWCLTIRRALLNLATLAMVSAARHLSSLFGDCSICTSIGRPTDHDRNHCGSEQMYQPKILNFTIIRTLSSALRELEQFHWSATSSPARSTMAVQVRLFVEISLSILSVPILQRDSSVSSKLMSRSSPPESLMAS